MKTITRRRMISGLGAGLAAAATPRIFAAQNVSKGDAMTTQQLEFHHVDARVDSGVESIGSLRSK